MPPVDVPVTKHVLLLGEVDVLLKAMHAMGLVDATATTEWARLLARLR